MRAKLLTAARRYHLGQEFPYEGFVQRAIEAHFLTAGFELDVTTAVDLLCTHPLTGEAWHVEAKGKTSAVGLDFRTCLGQLLQRMSRPETKHAVALPDLPTYRAQAAQVSSWVQELLGLHWLFISPSGMVEVVRAVSRQNL
jgi:hypothetical protein